MLGTLTEQESQALEHWLQDARHQREAQQLEQVWKRTADYKKDFQPNVERGLGQLKARMQAQEAPASAKERRMKPGRILSIAAGIAALLVLGTLLWQQFGTAQEYTVVTTDENHERVELSDGTTVLLNQHSTLRYPVAFAKNLRTVELEGEAFFEVAENVDQPFVIRLAQTKVTVLGTSFNVRAYLDEAFTEVTVQSGKVRFAIEQTEQAKILTTQQKAIYNHGRSFQVGRDDSLHAMDWMAGDLVFNNERLSTVLQYLERYYRVNLNLHNASIASCRITLSKRNFPSLESVLNTLRESLDVEIQELDAKNYEITTGVCPG